VHPEFQPQPIRAGSFELRPSITAGAEYNDNIYAREDFEEDDVILRVSPQLKVSRDYGLLDIDFDLASEHQRYLQNENEDSDDYRGSARITYGEGTDTRLSAMVSYRDQSEDRSRIDAISDVSVRGRFSDLEAALSARQRFGSLTAEVTGRYRDRDYDNVTDTSGVVHDYSFRDFKSYAAEGTIGYSRSGSSRLFVAGRYLRKEYDLRAGDPAFDPAIRFDRSAKSYRIEAGYSRQISALLFFSAQAGYLRYDLDDPRLPTVSGFAFDTRLLWNATPLTTVEIAARRAIDETASPDFAGVRRTEFAARLDHEILRNLIFSVDGRYSDLSPIGISANTDEFDFGLRAEYKLSRRFSFLGYARHRERDSDSPTLDFSGNVVGASIRYGF